MPSAVATALTDGLGDFSDAISTQFASLLPVALGVVIFVAVAFMAVRYFRGITKI